MKFGAFLMPSHPPERSIGDGQRRDLEDLERLDALGFEEAWIGEHFTAGAGPPRFEIVHFRATRPPRQHSS